MRARFEFFGYVFHNKVKEKRVNVSVKHSNLLTKGIVSQRVEGVPLKKDGSFNLIYIKQKEIILINI